MPFDEETAVDAGRSPGLGGSGVDQPLHAAFASLTAGLSPLALRLACADWIDHLALSPDKLMAFPQRAGRDWHRVVTYCAQDCHDRTCSDGVNIQILTDVDVTFVLSNGGHDAGIVNPPGHPHRRRQIATHREHEAYVDPDAWQQLADRHEGSRWPCWLGWLDRHSGEPVSPPPIGAPDSGYVLLADAPGTYVREP